MYNYRVTRLPYWAVFRLLFCAGTALGGLGGIMLGCLERDAVGIFGGMFLGLVFGLFSSLAGLFYVYVFNSLSPVLGGLPIQLEECPKASLAAVPVRHAATDAAKPPELDA